MIGGRPSRVESIYCIESYESNVNHLFSSFSFEIETDFLTWKATELKCPPKNGDCRVLLTCWKWGSEARPELGREKTSPPWQLISPFFARPCEDEQGKRWALSFKMMILVPDFPWKFSEFRKIVGITANRTVAFLKTDLMRQCEKDKWLRLACDKDKGKSYLYPTEWIFSSILAFISRSLWLKCENTWIVVTYSTYLQEVKWRRDYSHHRRIGG